MQNAKGAPHLLNLFAEFLLRAQKKFGERKGHLCAGLVGRIPRTGFAGCYGRPRGVALSATFEIFCFHSSFIEVLSALS